MVHVPIAGCCKPYITITIEYLEKVAMFYGLINNFLTMKQLLLKLYVLFEPSEKKNLYLVRVKEEQIKQTKWWNSKYSSLLSDKELTDVA